MQSPGTVLPALRQDSTTLGLIGLAGLMGLVMANLGMIDPVLSSYTSCSYYSRVMLSTVDMSSSRLLFESGILTKMYSSNRQAHLNVSRRNVGSLPLRLGTKCSPKALRVQQVDSSMLHASV